MKKIAIASLGFLVLFSAAVTSLADSGEADLGFDTGRLFFTFQAPSGNLADLPMTPNTAHNPLELPCDVQLFGGQLDVRYGGQGPSTFPRVTVDFFAESGAVIPGSGCTGNGFKSLTMDLPIMTAGAVQSAGYTPVAAPPATFCDWQYQPSNLPADQAVRMHLALAGSSDAAHLQPIGDPNPANNTVDVWVKRECSCK